MELDSGQRRQVALERSLKAPQHDWHKLFVSANEMMLKSFDDHQGDVSGQRERSPSGKKEIRRGRS